jgi:hypothetical protein
MSLIYVVGLMLTPFAGPETKGNHCQCDSGRITLVLFRMRRLDECSRLKEGVRRRVRKSRQKEAAGAADAGLMQIEWSERGVQKFTGVVKAAGVATGAPVQRRVDGGSEPWRGQEEDVQW